MLKISVFTLILATFLVANCLALICPDQKERCRSGQTCCANGQGGYGCCPYSNATCCTDGLHCCPSGTSCDLSAARCRRNSQLNSALPQPPQHSSSPKSDLEDYPAAEDYGNAYDDSDDGSIDNNFL